MKKISEAIHTFARERWWALLVMLIITIIFLKGIMDPLEAEIMKYSGGEGVLDLFFFRHDRPYTATEAREILTSYGHEGRTAYTRALICADFIWPLLPTSVLVLIISLTYGYICPKGSRWEGARLINLIPFAATVSDYAENTAILAALSGFSADAAPSWWLAYAGAMTMLKSSLIIMIVATAGIGLSLSAIKAVISRR